jgi:hypothetical protein
MGNFMETKKRNEKRVRKNLLIYTDDGRFDLLGVSSNISKSGLFIESPYSMSSDSEVLLAVVVDDELYRLKGEVRWVKRPGDEHPAHTPAGMGIHITEAPVEYLNYVEYARYETNAGGSGLNGSTDPS